MEKEKELPSWANGAVFYVSAMEPPHSAYVRKAIATEKLELGHRDLVVSAKYFDIVHRVLRAPLVVPGSTRAQYLANRGRLMEEKHKLPLPALEWKDVQHSPFPENQRRENLLSL